MTDQARQVREHLTDAHALCDALGLLSGRRGRDWMRQSRGVMILCPWHDERSPSCSVVRAEDGTIAARCHGCGATGDALSLVAAALHLEIARDFPEVLREAAHIAGIHLDDVSDGWRPRTPPPRPPPPPEVEPLDDETFAELARVLLEGCSLLAPEGRDVADYLIGRRLGRLALAEGWGALPGGVAELEALRARIVSAVGDDAWIRSGLAIRSERRRGAWVWATHRLVIPWRDPDGRVQTIQRRCIGTPPEGAGKYLFPSGRPARWPYGVDRITPGGDVERLAYVEGAVDVLALRALCPSQGLDADVIGLPGVQSWRGARSSAWAELARGRIAVLALDLDPRAKAAENVEAMRQAMFADLGAAGAVRIDRWDPPEGSKDWADAWESARKVAA